MIENSFYAERPSIGRIFEVSTPIEQFEKNRLYILPNATTVLESSILEIESEIIEFVSSQNYLNKYGLINIEDELIFSEKTELSEAINSDEYNLLLQMNCPSTDKSIYLLAKTNEDNIFANICMMLNTAERISTRNYIEAIQTFLKENPDQFTKVFDPIFDDEDFQKNFYSSGIHALYAPNYGMVPSSKQIQETLGFKDGKLSFKEKNEMLNNLSEIIINSNHEDEKATMALWYIVKSTSPECFFEMFKKLTPGNVKKVKSLIDPSNYAASSPLKIYVCKPEDKENYVFEKNAKRKNDEGVYQLFLEKGNEVVHVHFPHKNSFIVYLIYLIDRYRKDDKVDTIDLLDKEKLYKSLYKEVYPHDTNCDTSYNTLVSEYNDKGEKRETRVGECLSEIRLTISNVCEKLHESPAAPHIIADASSHIYTRSSNLSVSFILVDLAR